MEENHSVTASGFGQPHFCSQCGAKLEASDKFCASCGTPVARQAVPSARAMETPPPCDTNRGNWAYSERASRSEYWFTLLKVFGPIFVISVVLLVLTVLADERVVRGAVGEMLKGHLVNTIIFVGILNIVGGILTLPATIRRLHDHGISGLWLILIYALGFIPYVNSISGLASFVFLGCMRGTIGDNRYGPDPLERRS